MYLTQDTLDKLDKEPSYLQTMDAETRRMVLFCANIGYLAWRKINPDKLRTAVQFLEAIPFLRDTSVALWHLAVSLGPDATTLAERRGRQKGLRDVKDQLLDNPEGALDWVNREIRGESHE